MRKAIKENDVLWVFGENSLVLLSVFTIVTVKECWSVMISDKEWI